MADGGLSAPRNCHSLMSRCRSQSWALASHRVPLGSETYPPLPGHVVSEQRQCSVEGRLRELSFVAAGQWQDTVSGPALGGARWALTGKDLFCRCTFAHEHLHPLGKAHVSRLTHSWASARVLCCRRRICNGVGGIHITDWRSCSKAAEQLVHVRVQFSQATLL